ncbi:MAG: FAD-dependent oxidoreductase [Christensenellaceae bacterium]|jgi:thioredoxin reductase (NADPH)|nr:FAD-dependent oxidoreductase [Christensenellaceae bacterium]
MYDIVIAGGGPSGLTAAIYAARAGKKVVVVSETIGGAASSAHNIENFSGHISISGFELMQTMFKQCQNLAVSFITDIISKMELSGDDKIITLYSGERLSSKKVILAMGATHKKLGLDGEDNLLGQGLSYCATCDGNFYKGRRVIVNGGGDTAVSDALFLAPIAKRVTLLHRRQTFRASKHLVDKLKDAGVNLVLDSVITALKGAPLISVVVRNVLTQRMTEIETDGLFVAIGVTPNSALVSSEVALNESGHIITDALMQTNIKDVYAVGDIRNTSLRQIITACADGAIAAETAFKM